MVHLGDIDKIGFNVADTLCGKHIESSPPRVMIADDHAFTWAAMSGTKICAKCTESYESNKKP